MLEKGEQRQASVTRRRRRRRSGRPLRVTMQQVEGTPLVWHETTPVPKEGRKHLHQQRATTPTIKTTTSFS